MTGPYSVCMRISIKSNQSNVLTYRESSLATLTSSPSKKKLPNLIKPDHLENKTKNTSTLSSRPIEPRQK